MAIKWKKSRKLNPDVILEKIDSIKIVQDEGRVSYSGFKYLEAIPALFSMLDFGKNLPWEIKSKIVKKAISKVAAVEKLNSKSVISEINNEFQNYHSTKENEYFLLTSISLDEPLPSKLIDINGCNIRIFKREYPRKYASRLTLVNKWRKPFEHTQEGYSKVIVKSKAKSPQEAVSKSLESIDLIRATWNIFANLRMEIFGDPWKPINNIRLGAMHSLHKKSGELAVEYFWYEPEFRVAKPYRIKEENYKVFKKNANWVKAQIKSCKYSLKLIDAFVRYVRALDESNPNTAAFKLWGAIESIAAPSENRYDNITRRCAFLFEEYEYHKQMLEHLREYRNSTVHAGEESVNAKDNCFQLQFYFYHLMQFHLLSVKKVVSLNDANSFLDLPADLKVLEQRKHFIEMAIKFVGGA